MLLLIPLFGLCLTMTGVGQQPVGAMAPHKLDPLFAKAGQDEKAIVNALLNDDLFKKAVKEAAKVNTPPKQGVVGPMAGQSARAKFLEVLKDEKDVKGVGAAAPGK